MRLPDMLVKRLRGSPRVGVGTGAAVAAVIAVCGLVMWLLPLRGGDSPNTSDVLAVSISPTATAPPTLTPLPSATPIATPPPPMEAAAAPAEGDNSQAPSGPAAESGMSMVIPKIGVNAPVTVRVMGSDGVMGPPNGRFDVVWYDFSALPGMGGYPGSSSNAVFSGHVDYHPHYEAVFWDLHLLAPGDIIEVHLPDGTVARYSVQWSQEIDPESDFSSYCRDTGEATITIVTCQGTFDPTTRHYDHRLVVRGALIP
jgi:LPXTG-site transpeptidase (sortase) family protein